VHAWGQVCSYEHEAVDPLRLNGLLPRDVAVLDCNPAPDGFNARHDAVSRTYCYRVLHRRARSVWFENRALWHAWELDAAALDACAQALAGTHDFTAFTPTDTYHTRFEREVLCAEWRADGDLLEFWITADTFMRQMNRILVGTMLEVASGRRTLSDFVALLEGAPRSRAGQTAPPHGLALAAVGYPPYPR
jgi:tRNA pseudouridine38-40 synthase